MVRQTTLAQRQEFCKRHQRESYVQIAEDTGFSKECVRYWCRRQRDGKNLQTAHPPHARGLLSHFAPLVRYVVLRLRLEHPHWGPGRICFHLRKRVSLRGLPLPSSAQIGRYLHQWSCFRRLQRSRALRPGHQPTTVYQCWQMDFKEGIVLTSDTVSLHTVFDAVAEACMGAVVHVTEQVEQRTSKPTFPQVRDTLRHCFARWGILPKELQTDGEPSLFGPATSTFPAPLVLWLKGLGIDHHFIRPGRPTDNAEVERGHRTLCDYAIVGNEHLAPAALQVVLDQAVEELIFELPSQATGCRGRPPIQAHPEIQPVNPCSFNERALFDLKRIDAYLAALHWERRVDVTGTVCLAQQDYVLGRCYTKQQVLIKFDPTDRHFVFYSAHQPDAEIGRLPAKRLEIEDLVGSPDEPSRIALPLPAELAWPISPEGVYC